MIYLVIALLLLGAVKMFVDLKHDYKAYSNKLNAHPIGRIFLFTICLLWPFIVLFGLFCAVLKKAGICDVRKKFKVEGE